jgi:thiol peroxidase
MSRNRKHLLGLWMITVLIFGCASSKPDIPVDRGSIEPGTFVTRGDKQFRLLGTPIAIGKSLPSVMLVDAMTGQEVDLSQQKGSILFLSIVPSIDTAVCEAQTHLLGEKGNKLPGDVKRITISRDTPFAQKRFAEEAKLTQIQYLSDYKQGDFGRSLGLLVDGSMLLSRSVILVDKQGVVQYIQVVPNLGHLPDMEKAFQEATTLAQAGS